MNLNIGICDDEMQHVHQLNSYLNTYEIETDHNFGISSHITAADLLKAYKEPKPFHILFLDVEMPEMNGLELAKRIRSIPDKQVKIIFISNYPEYMQESFDVQAFYYLNKPVSYESLKDIMERIITEFTDDTFSRLVINNGDSSELINYADILYLEALKNERTTLRLVMTHGERIIKGTLSEYEELLKDTGFISSHRSFLVNLKHVKLIQKNRIVLNNECNVPLSRRREKDIKKIFAKQVLHMYQKNY